MLTLNMLYINILTWLPSFPLVLAAWLFSRKRIKWKWYEFTVLIGSPIVWQLLLSYFPVGKSLSNVFVELFVLGIGLGALFIIVAAVGIKKQLFRMSTLIFLSLIFPIFIYLTIPVLPE